MQLWLVCVRGARTGAARLGLGLARVARARAGARVRARANPPSWDQAEVSCIGGRLPWLGVCAGEEEEGRRGGYARACVAQHVVHGEAPEALALRDADGGLGRQHGDVVRGERAAQHLLQPLTPLESQSTAVGWDVHLALRGAPDALDERWVGLLLREARHRCRLRRSPNYLSSRCCIHPTQLFFISTNLYDTNSALSQRRKFSSYIVHAHSICGSHALCLYTRSNLRNCVSDQSCHVLAVTSCNRSLQGGYSTTLDRERGTRER